MRNDDAAREWENGIFFEGKNLAERGEILGWVGSEGAREQYNSNSLIKESVTIFFYRFVVGT